MAISLFPVHLTAVWGVLKGEYEIRNATPLPRVTEGVALPSKEEEYIVCKGPEEQRIYPPLGVALLHRKLARLETNDDILKFVEKYGFLREGTMVFPPEGGKSLGYGEKLVDWYNLISRLRTLLNLWELVKRKSPKLGEIVIWDWKKQRVGVTLGPVLEPKLKHRIEQFKLPEKKLPPYPGEWIADKENIRPDIWERFSRNRSPSEVAKYYLCQQIAKGPEKQFSLILFPFDSNRLVFTPATLEAAIWYHFALEVSEQVYVRVCPYCGDTFALGRNDQKFCSKQCRQSFWYHTKTGKQITYPEGAKNG